MKKYVVEITETLQRQIIVDARSYDEARSIVKQKYEYEEIVLDESDHVDTEFKVISKIRDKEHMER